MTRQRVRHLHQLFILIVVITLSLIQISKQNRDFGNSIVKAFAVVGQVTNKQKNTSVVPVAAAPTNCTCVNCYEDSHCGGLWSGTTIVDEDKQQQQPSKISIVVAHCNRNLSWLSNFTRGFEIDSITIISKCQLQVEGAPPNSKIIRPEENAGRCDHSYAYYITQLLKDQNIGTNTSTTTKHPQNFEKDDIVLFLKDTRDPALLHLKGYYRSLESLVRIASSPQGFACGVKQRGNGYPPGNRPLREYIMYSAYASTPKLVEFQMGGYKRLKYGNVTVKHANFKKGQLTPMKKWLEAMSITLPLNLTALCVGGSFAVARNQIYRHSLPMYENIEQSLTRGDAIIESHYAERTWAGLFSEPLTSYQIEALHAYQTTISNDQGAIIGMLQKSLGKNKTAFDTLDVGP